MKRSLFQIAMTVVAASLPHLATAEILTVCASGCDWTTVQGAIDAATTGDTVLIADTVHIEAGVSVHTSVTIAGSSGTTLQASEQPGQGAGRLLSITTGASVQLRDLTLRHGDTFDQGGAIHNLGTLSLERVELRSNRANLDGGAIFNSGTLTMTNSYLLFNESIGHGGSVFNAATGELQISNSQFDGNLAPLGDGGHLFNSGDASVFHCSFDDGFALENGGAISNQGYLVLSASFTDNHAVSNGGAISQSEDAASLVLRDSHFYQNRATFRGGGLYINEGSASVQSITLFGNLAALGAGIFLDEQLAVEVVNSTLVGNTARYSGGGIYVGASTRLNLASTTVWENIADSDLNGTGDGGGIHLEPCTGLCVVTSAHVQNSIVSGNLDESPAGFTVADDCDGELTSQGYNLVEGATSLGPCQVDGDLSGVLVGVYAALGPIGDHGGPLIDPLGTVPLTARPDPGSPAIDGGNPGGCTDFQGSALPRDQRGALRVGVCDLGSFEFEGKLPLFKNGFESDDTSGWSPP